MHSNRDEFFDDLDARDIAQSIRQEREDFRGCFLIVEGKNDNKTLRSHVDETTCSLQIAGNKALALETLRELEDEGFEGVICIVDTDYEYEEFAGESFDNLVETKVHDLDIAIFSTSALLKYVAERCDHEMVSTLQDLHKKDLRSIIFDAAYPIGCLRLLSHKNKRNMRLNFSKLTFNFIERLTLKNDTAMLLSEVLSTSRKQRLSDKEIQSRYETVLRQRHDPKRVCQGHDIAEIISIGLQACLAKLVHPRTGNPDPRSWRSEVEMGLRLSFGREQFEETELYAGIVEWESRNSPFSVLKYNKPSTILDRVKTAE